jgi:dipeptidyl aminopeptidase/acylaminoacyl peptidase
VVNFVFAGVLITACSPAAPLPSPSPPPSATSTLQPPAITLVAPTGTPLPSPTAPPTETAAPTITPTPDPYAGLTVADLASRAYGGGELQVIETLAAAEAFTRYLVAYPSDGLTVFGFMNVPAGEGPFPVILAVHGYIDPGIYTTLDYTTRYADALARAGYLVLHPNLRGYAPSEGGPNPFRVGFAVDVLNLIALVREHGGGPGPLQAADPEAIGLWGHSMGGGISIRAMTVSPDVRAVVLYGSMSGDEQANFERILVWSGGTSGQEELATAPEDLQRISPIYHLDRVQAAVSIHHGDADATVPLPWSLDLCERLRALNKPVECHTYAGQPHTFTGDGDQLFMARVAEFFDAWLKTP